MFIDSCSSSAQINKQPYFLGQAYINKMLPQKIKIGSEYCPKTTMPTHQSVPAPDLHIYAGQAIIPVHRLRLSDCHNVPTDSHCTQKFLLLDPQIKVQAVRRVLGFLYGHDLELEALSELENILEVAVVLDFALLVTKLQQVLSAHIKSLDLFIMLSLSHRFGLADLQEVCLRYLQVEQYEQVKYNKYSLCQCSFEVFQKILRRHHLLKQENKIDGLDLDTIQQTISIYCKRNHIDQQTEAKLLGKYVDPWRSADRQAKLNKCSLRLYKFNNQGNSLGNSSEKKEEKDMSITGPSSGELVVVRPVYRKRKYSMEIGKALQEMGLETTSRAQLIQSASIESIPENDTNQSVIVSTNLNYHQLQTPANPSLQVIEKLLDSEREPQSPIHRLEIRQISRLVDSYESNLKESQNNFNCLKRKNTQSMIFQEVIEEQMEESMEHRSRRFAKKPPRLSHAPCTLKTKY